MIIKLDLPRYFLFEFHLFWNTSSIGILQLKVHYKVDRLLTDLTAQQKEQLLDDIKIKHLYILKLKWQICKSWVTLTTEGHNETLTI